MWLTAIENPPAPSTPTMAQHPTNADNGSPSQSTTSTRQCRPRPGTTPHQRNSSPPPPTPTMVHHYHPPTPTTAEHHTSLTANMAHDQTPPTVTSAHHHPPHEQQQQPCVVCFLPLMVDTFNMYLSYFVLLRCQYHTMLPDHYCCFGSKT